MNDLQVFIAWLKKNEFELANQIRLDERVLHKSHLQAIKISNLDRFSTALDLIEDFQKSTTYF